MIKLTQIEELEIALSVERSDRRAAEAGHRSAMRDRDIRIEGLENDVRVHLAAIAQANDRAIGYENVCAALDAAYVKLDNVKQERDNVKQECGAAYEELDNVMRDRDAAYEELAEVKQERDSAYEERDDALRALNRAENGSVLN